MATCIDISTAAGTTLAIGAALPATYDASGYGAVSWTVVGGISAISAFGKEFQVVTFEQLGDRNTCKRKGTSNAGRLDITLAHVAEDAGQAAMLAHLDSDATLPFRVLLNDTNATYDGTGTTFYLPGQTMSFRVDPGSSPNAIVTATVAIEIDGDIVKVDRAAA
jgi:hypothetical protein